MKGAVYPVYRQISVFQMVSFSMVTKLLLVFTIRILKNSCKCGALTTALFTMGGAISLETMSLWLIIYSNAFTKPKDIASSL